MVRAVKAVGPTPRFHADWLHNAFADGVDIGALSVGRGGGKTWLLAKVAAVALTPGSPLWRPELEILAVSASLAQSRTMLGMLRQHLDLDDYSVADSDQRISVTHKATGCRFRVLSSSGKRALGLSQFSLIVADEPASWEERNGRLLFDAIRQSLGKLPHQRVLLIGTRAPSPDGGWWPELLDAGSGDGIHVTDLFAGPELAWDSWAAICAANPLVHTVATIRQRILRERDEARRTPTLRPAYEAYRLNRGGIGEDTVLVPADAWRRVLDREVPPRAGRPVVGLDLGAERSWSAIWALWPSGRSECYAVVGGIPDLADRERQDAKPAGMYQRLEADGVLVVDEGRHIARPSTLISHMMERGINPSLILCDRFAVGTLRDAVARRWPIKERVTRWSEATEDIAAFRQMVQDGPLAVAEECRALASVSIAQAAVKADDSGSVRLVKRAGRRSRDDVAVAGTLAAGEIVRRAGRPKRRAPRSSLTWTGR